MKHDHDYAVFISFYFICVYRSCFCFSFSLFGAACFALPLNQFIDVVGSASTWKSMEKCWFKNNKFTVHHERKRWARTVARACIALNCTSKREQTVLTLETRWLKRFPRNFGISAVFNYAEVLNFRWPFGCTSCIFHFAELRADYNFVDALNAIAK